jgi:predicted component of type VI protein secretion system
MPKLVFIDHNFSGKVYPLTIEKTTIGRSEENILVIRDPSLSSRHCEILVHGEEVIVRDLGSRNGTMVGKRLLKNQQSPVKNGEVVRFGAVDARVEIEVAAWADDTSPESAVIDHRQVMRDQRRAQKNPVPANPSLKLGSGAAEDTEPRTILIPAPPPAAPEVSAKETPVPASHEGSPGRGLTWVWMAIAALGLWLLVWLIWGRR